MKRFGADNYLKLKYWG